MREPLTYEEVLEALLESHKERERYWQVRRRKPKKGSDLSKQEDTDSERNDTDGGNKENDKR